MIRTKQLLFIIIVFFAVVSCTQKKREITMQWNIAAELPSLQEGKKALGFAGPVAGVHHNKLIIAGGANFPDSMPWEGGKKVYHDEVYVYDKDFVLYDKVFKLPANIAYAASCATPQGIVYIGGENENGISSKVILLQWDEASASVVTSELPDLPVATTNAAATFHENKVYVAGGETASAASAGFYCLNLNAVETGWQQLPSIPKPVSNSVLTIVQSDNNTASIFLAGGRKKNTTGISDLYNSVFEYNILTNQWKEKRSLPYALSAGTGISHGNNILLFGGDKGETFHKVETLIAAINAEKDEIKKQELIQQKNKLQISHPGFSNDILSYNTTRDEWTIADSIPFIVPVTTVATEWDDNVIITSGEIRAGVRTPQILSGRFYNNQ